MSDEPKNKPDLICLNMAYHAVKHSIEEVIVREIVARFTKKESFTIEVKINEPGTDSCWGDFASVKFNPPNSATEETKP